MESSVFEFQEDIFDKIKEGYRVIVEPTVPHSILRSPEELPRLNHVLINGFHTFFGERRSGKEIRPDLSREISLDLGAEGILARVEEPDENYFDDIYDCAEFAPPHYLITVDWGRGQYALYGDWSDESPYEERKLEYDGVKIENFSKLRIKRVDPPEDIKQLRLKI